MKWLKYASFKNYEEKSLLLGHFLVEIVVQNHRS